MKPSLPLCLLWQHNVHLKVVSRLINQVTQKAPAQSEKQTEEGSEAGPWCGISSPVTEAL